MDLESIVTPVKIEEFHNLLIESEYDKEEAEFLVSGFTHGFSIGYQGRTDRRDISDNIPITIGSKEEMWQKIMKEVRLGRYAGPFKKPPYKNFIQSPIGLVPKANNQTRLIFHLSYDFANGNKSVNSCTPKELCSVKYNDIDQAIQACLKVGAIKKKIFTAKSDLLSAFRVAPICRKHWRWLTMKCTNPLTGELVYFVDKCLPFGASISCSHFQRISNGLRHVFEFMLGINQREAVINYLDDFLFITDDLSRCNRMVRVFLQTCQSVGIPVSLDKTEWGSLFTTFLGLLIDGQNMALSVPENKRMKAINLLGNCVHKKKATVEEIQRLGGLLNFLTKAVYPGRVFTRRMYACFGGCLIKKGNRIVTKSGFELRSYHHINLSLEFREDCKVWLFFLDNLHIVQRPMIDFDDESSTLLNMYSDASLNERLGFGCWFGKFWIFGRWEHNFVRENKPSIAYLELYALCIGIFTWQNQLQNCRITIYCDNKSARDMINSTVSNCKNCMRLLRMLTLNNLIHNRRVFAKYVKTNENTCADALSRLQFGRFFKNVPKNIDINKNPDPLPQDLWPLSKIWIPTS